MSCKNGIDQLWFQRVKIYLLLVCQGVDLTTQLLISFYSLLKKDLIKFTQLSPIEVEIRVYRITACFKESCKFEPLGVNSELKPNMAALPLSKMSNIDTKYKYKCKYKYKHKW